MTNEIDQYIAVYVDLFKQAVRNGLKVDPHLSITCCRYVRYCGKSPPRVNELAHLLAQLPPVIARKKVHEYFGGVIVSRMLSEADNRGIGPRVRWNVGKNICYPTPYLLEWIEECLPLKTKELKNGLHGTFR
jgi:hypothetical protein